MMSEIPSNEEFVQQVRKRPGMYFMSAGFLGLEHLIYELVGNVLDLYLLGQATCVNIKLNNTSFVIEDDGPGFPFDVPSDLPDVSLASRRLSDFHHAVSHDNHVPHVHVKTWGVGLAPVTAVSAPLIIQSWRNGDLWGQVFEKGVAQSAPQITDRGSGRGTTITITPDPELFGDSKPRKYLVRQSLFEMAHIFGGLKVGFQMETFHAPQGLYDLGWLYSGGMDSHCWDVEPFHIRLKSQDIEFEVAIFGDCNDSSYRPRQSSQHICSWVNGARTVNQGSHVTGMLNALAAVNWDPELMLIHVIMHDPEYAGPMRSKLDAPHVAQAVETALQKLLCEHRQNTSHRRMRKPN